MAIDDGSPAFSSTPPPLRPLQVLLVEDDEVNRKVSQAFLERGGHGVTVAINGVEALEAVQDQIFDVVLMDIRMPVMDGVEATRRIRALADPGRAQLPIIALTANFSPAEMESYGRAGIDAVLRKPLKLGDIESALAPFFGEEEAPPPPAAAPVLDGARISLLAEAIEPETLAELLDAARSSIAETTAELARIWPAGDCQAIGKHAHRLAGVAANFGCAALCEISRDLEALCRQGEAGEPLRPRLDALVAETLAALSSVLPATAAPGTGS